MNTRRSDRQHVPRWLYVLRFIDLLHACISQACARRHHATRSAMNDRPRGVS